MLCDLFSEYRATKEFKSLGSPLASPISFIGDLVENSPRFTLDRSATMMIQNMSTGDPKSFVTALPVCKSPYKTFWVEMAFRDRHDWLVAQMEKGMPIVEYEMSKQPQRLGFLYMTREDSPGYILVQPVWTHEPPVVEMASMALLINTGEGPTDAEVLKMAHELFADTSLREKNRYKRVEDVLSFAALSLRIDYVRTPWYEDFWKKIDQNAGAIRKHAEEAARYDLSAEWRFALSLLISLNSRNILGTGEVVDVTKLNKARQKAKRPLLLNHAPITLNLSPALKRRISNPSTRAHSMASAEPHMVRGHFKVRKTGVYWWSPHPRSGDADLGQVKYNVVAR